MQDINEKMVEKYGPLLTINDAANILSRSSDGLRVSLYRDLPLYNQLRKIKRRIGKNIYFPTQNFFEVIMNADVNSN